VTLAIAPITDADIEATIALWQRCGLTRPWNDPAADIALARKGDNSTVLLGHEGGALAAAIMVGHDGHRGWVYYLGVDPDRRGQGLGRTIMEAAEDWLRQRGILKLMLMVRLENTQVQTFYESIGYDQQPRTIYAKWLDGREPSP
jgi:ribosomal protein S18 acetylase RimI-like enzyme